MPKTPEPTAIQAASAVVVVTPATLTVPDDAAKQLAPSLATDGKPKGNGNDPADEAVTTSHAVTINGEAVRYTATAGTIVLREEDGKPRAKLFYVAYTRDNVDDPAKRPITFSFNGGPGSSSVWLHLGLFGPRRVEIPDDASSPKPPFDLLDNEHSLLDVSDFVFIDPVSTGYSRAATPEGAKQFHNVTEDVASVAEFIRLYTTRAKRWSSPKLLAGESYGTTRAAALAGHLQDRHGIFLSGILLISTVLNFQTILFDQGNDLPYPLFLPTYAATAWYHRRLAKPLQADLKATLAQAEDFAAGDYTLALMQGDRISARRASSIAAQVARFTGLPRVQVEQANLRVRIGRFTKSLLRDQRLTVGRLDSRFVGRDEDAAGENFTYDPSYSAIQGPYTAALNAYVRQELNYENDLPYEILTDRVRPWDFGEQNRYLNVAETLRDAMCKNPHLKIYVASGYYDLATPYFATDYTTAHLGLEPDLARNIRLGTFEAGHMMYIHGPSLTRQRAEMVEFIAGLA